MRRNLGLRLTSVVFGVVTILELVQLVEAARGRHPDPMGLLFVHALSAVLAGAAAVGTWRARAWAPAAVLGWGLVMSAMLATLGPVLDEPRESWRVLWIAAGVVFLAATAAAWYVRRSVGSGS